jgi:hypothetical protein
MATQDTQIRLYDKPRRVSLDRVLAESATALLVAGIVNPMGPTLTAVVVPGTLKPGNKLPVAQLMLNPFSQEVVTVGELVLGNKWRPSSVIRRLFRLSFGGCPTLLLPSIHLEDDRSISLHAEFLRGFEDARYVLERVRQYFGNPWDRVSQEMNAAFEGIAKPAAGARGQAHAEQLNEDEARELAGLLLSEEHTKPELQAFRDAWKGSIKFQREQGLPAMADAAMSLETFHEVFTRIAQSCLVPDVGESAPPNPITELRETAEIAFHQGYKVRDKAKTEEALTVLVTQLFELFGESPQFNQFFQVLYTVKRAVEVEDWESGTAPLLAVLAKLRQAEASMQDEQA